MLVWLDGRLNVRNQPQENFARELMELFTMGVGTFAETDVYAGARVFTGWNLPERRLVGRSSLATSPPTTRPRRRRSRSPSTRMAGRPSQRARRIPVCRTAST